MPKDGKMKGIAGYEKLRQESSSGIIQPGRKLVMASCAMTRRKRQLWILE